MPSTTTQTISATGAWQPLLATTGAWLLTANDNFRYAWGTAAPSESIYGHHEYADRNIRIEVLAGETFYVRVHRPTRFTLTPEA